MTGVTEGTRTPDLQGHNLGAVAGGEPRRPRDTRSDLRASRVVASIGRRTAMAAREGMTSRVVVEK
jgi:hypothetical protein